MTQLYTTDVNLSVQHHRLLDDSYMYANDTLLYPMPIPALYSLLLLHHVNHPTGSLIKREEKQCLLGKVQSSLLLV